MQKFLRELKDKIQSGKTIFANHRFTKGFYSEHMTNSHNSTVNKRPN